jgi:hypothetical protein
MTTDISTTLATEINAEHAAALSAVRSGLEHARRAGALLIEAKAALEHGAWLPWLAEQCPRILERTAQGYMRLAREWPRLEAAGNTQRVADLPLREALLILAEPKPTTEADAGNPWRDWLATADKIVAEPDATAADREAATDPLYRIRAELAAQLYDLGAVLSVSPPGLTLPEGLSFETWKEIGRILRAFGFPLEEMGHGF